MTGQDSGEFLSVDVAWDELQSQLREQRAKLEQMRSSLEAVAERYHKRMHNRIGSFMDCSQTYCREIATVLRLTADTNHTADTTQT